MAVPADAAGQGGGTCYPVNFTWICVYNGNGGGSPGSGGGSGTVTCTYTKASPGVLQRAGIGPPARGYQWDIMTCPGSNAGPLGGQLVQVSTTTGTPAISPFDLFKIAIGELSVPTLAAATAPPRGKDGLVGLPEWYWVARGQWHPASVTVRAGPVWATATASPTALSYVPGGGMGSVSCRGPGTPFDRAQASRAAAHGLLLHLHPGIQRPARQRLPGRAVRHLDGQLDRFGQVRAAWSRTTTRQGTRSPSGWPRPRHW